MSSPLQDLKNAFGAGGNGLTRLIIVNVAVFVVINVVQVLGLAPSMAQAGNWLLSQLSMPAYPPAFLHKPWTLVTYFFTHEGIFHILFNMLFLYWFGQIVHEYLGNRRLMSIYFLGGMFGGLLYLLAYRFVPPFRELAPYVTMIGASGAVYAVVTAAATLTPNYTFFLMFLGPVRIVYIAAFYIFMSFIDIKNGNPGGNIAHLGGALLGFLFIKSLRSGTDLGGWFWSLWDRIATPRTGRMTVSHRARSTGGSGRSRAAKTSGSPKSPAQDEIDAILDKINRVGYENLTREEKEKLFSAGQGGGS